MKVLVTGGCGFIGTNLIEYLLNAYGQQDIHIIVLDNYTSGIKTNEIQSTSVTYIEGNTWDIWNINQLRDFDADIVFHFGEFSRIVQSFDNPNLCFTSNLHGTQQILDYCVKKKAKLIYSGSSSIFGNDMKDQHLNPYSWTKAKNIELIKNYGVWFGLKYAIAYFYNVYGPRQITEGTYATVIGIFERQIQQGEPLSVVSPGTQQRAFTHIEDIVHGLYLILQYGDGDGYFLGTDKNISILEVAAMFNRPYIMIPERRGERIQSTLYESRAKTELNWQPRWSLEDYIKMLY